MNCSLGSEEVSNGVLVRLEQARQAGVAVIVAAGNSSGPVQFPAKAETVLSVSAIGQSGQYPADTYHAKTLPDHGVPGVTLGTGGIFFPRFSCFGPEIKVCAPGVAIISSVPGGGFAAWDGTSMAAPHITGMAALIAAHHPEIKGTPRNAARVDRLFQLVMGIAQAVGLAPPYSGAGLPTGGNWTAINGQLPVQGQEMAGSMNEASVAGLVNAVSLEETVRAIILATVAYTNRLR